MAESKDTVARLDRLEGALVQITDVLVRQSERFDTLRDEVRLTREALTDRLDRLIAITTKERTFGVERLANIEQRLSKLEEHVGI